MVEWLVLMSIKKPARPSTEVLQIDKLVVRNSRGLKAVDGLTLEIKAGEILCVAGIDGNGQSELIQAITGLLKIESGSMFF